MKRTLAFLLAFVMMLSLCVSFGAFTALADDEAPAEAAEPAPEELEHDWAKATCTEPRTCTVCGATEGEPKGHKVEEWTTVQKATCTEAGLKTGVCSRCGETVEKVIESKGHKVEEWETVQKATCTEAGLKTGVCKRCGETVEKVIEPKGHKDGKWKTTKEPTPDDLSMTRVLHCERCGEILQEEESTLTKKEFKSWYKKACKEISFKKISKNPEKYLGRKIKISGDVIQMSSSEETYTLIVAVHHSHGYYDQFYRVVYNGELPDSFRWFGGTYWGEFNGLVATGGGMIPEMTALYMK